MAVLIVGGGLAGCSTALELASRGQDVIVVERERSIGGKVRHYGCKAAERCLNCGLCLVGDLWHQVESHPRIAAQTDTVLVDVMGEPGSFSAVTRRCSKLQVIDGISHIVVATGFVESSAAAVGAVEYARPAPGIIHGLELEQLMMQRTKDALWDGAPPTSVAFLQCYGSRSLRDRTQYCSRVCCSYTSRAARVFKHYYPDARVVFLHMEQQQVEPGSYWRSLEAEGIEFVRSRPITVLAGPPHSVIYERKEDAQIVEEEFDIVVLSEGMHPNPDGDRMAEICRLGFSPDGFLQTVRAPSETGVSVVGCARGPQRIEEVVTDALQTARGICGGVR